MIEALKQALEAIEYRMCSRCDESIDCCLPKSKNAVKSLRQAIAELESQEPDVVMHWHSHTWTTINPPPKNSGDVNLYYAPPQRTEPKVCCQQYDTCLEPCTPRGTHLAQRTWVGLTDEEKKNIFLKWYGKQWGYTSSIKSVMSSVEAKLREKNNA